MAQQFKNFNYIDQLQDTVINLDKYLTTFSDANYSLEFQNIQPVKATLRNLFEKLTLVDQFKAKGAKFRTYQIKDGELPEDVALRFYNTKDFWWIITLWNELKNPLTDWPLTEEQLIFLADTLSSVEDKYPRDSYYNFLFAQNEDLRLIEILDSGQLYAFISQLKSAIILEGTDGTKLRIRL